MGAICSANVRLCEKRLLTSKPTKELRMKIKFFIGQGNCMIHPTGMVPEILGNSLLIDAEIASRRQWFLLTVRRLLTAANESSTIPR